jgi:MFS family permease
MAVSSNAVKKYNEEIDRHYRWNTIGVMIDNAMFSIISLGLSQYTILPLYLNKITESKILIGLIPTVSIVGFAIPQIFIARLLKGKRQKKGYLVGTAAIQRVSILAFLILTMVQTRLHTNLTIALFFLIFAIQNFLAGCWFPMWVDFVGHAIPRNRGMVFGLSTSIGGLISLAGGGLITYLLKTLPYPNAITAAAAIAFIASLISLAAIISWHETVPPESDLIETSVIGSNLFHNIKLNKNFQQYLIWRGMIIGIEMALPFLTISALDRLQVADMQVGIFAIILSISQTVTNVCWGWLGDRIGFLRIVLVSTILGSLGIFIAISAGSLNMFYLVFVCAGAMLSGQQLANINIIYEFSESDHIPTYTAVHQLILSPISGVMPVVGGMIVNTFGYGILYWVATILGLSGTLGMSIMVKSPLKTIYKDAQEVHTN